MSKTSQFASLALLLLFTLAMGVHTHRAWMEWSWRHATSSWQAENACRVLEGNPDCWRAAARLREQEGGNALPLWSRSLDLDPRNVEAAIASALPLESAGQPQEAERLLLRAARLNQLWLPRWSLALFYSRRGRSDEFWRWARLAFERSYWDRAAMFRQCSAQGATAQFLLQHVLPVRLDLRLALLRYVTGQPVDGQLLPAAEAVVACARPEQRGDALPVLANAIAVLARMGHPDQAFRVWASMCDRRLTSYAAPTEQTPVTNSELQAPFMEAGFDWQMPPASGVSNLVLAGGKGVRFTLTGSQPAGAILLQQWLFLRGGQTWLLTVDARTQGIEPADSALYWRIIDEENGLPYEPDRAAVHGDEWTRLHFRFGGPPTDRLARLALVAAQRPGGVRLQGDISVRWVELRAEPRP